jgi:hypothetical protein
MTSGHLRALGACLFVLIVLAVLGQSTSAAIVGAEQASASCTQIVGFSQTMQWYFGGFRDTVGGISWELRWVGGGSIGNWADPNYVGWTDDSNLVDGCAQNVLSPDRALLNVSDDFHNDISYWVQQTNAAMNNLRRKYPSVRQIILQPVVGGPGGNQCTFNGSVVRASYNFPYINQAISQMANGGSVVAGDAPTVRSCSDYADNIGHLTDDAKGPIGVAIGNYYQPPLRSVATSPPTPTATPVVSSTPTRTPTTGPTSTPTNTPVARPTNTPLPTPQPASSFTVTFDDIAGKNRTLNGQYPSGTIDWGTNKWYLSGPVGGFSTKSVNFNGPQPTSEAFNLLRPLRLVRLDAYNGGNAPTTISLTCAGQATVRVGINARQTLNIATNWTGTCTSITVTSTNGSRTNFDNLQFDNGPTQSSGSTITFDDLSNPNRPLTGQYPDGVADWGTNQWYLSSPYGAFWTNSVSFNGAGPSSGTINVLSPKGLVQVDAYNGGSTSSVVTLSCAGQPTVSITLAAHATVTIATGWSGACSSVTIGSSNGWDTNFDNFVLQ